MASFLRPLASILLAAAILTPGAAAAQQYYCTIAQATNGWVPAEFRLEYAGSNAVVIHNWVDGVQSRQVRIRGNSTERRLNYSIITQGTGAQRTTMAFRLVHNVSSGVFSAQLNPAEYSNSFSGSGSCVPF